MSLTIEQINAAGQVTATAGGAKEAVLVTPGYTEGDKLVFRTEDAKYVAVKVHKDVAEAIIYVTGGVFDFPIPTGEALRGFAPGTFEGEQTVTLRIPVEEELKTYRNLCLNPLDYRVADEVVDPNAPEWSNPTESEAVEKGEIPAYPHVYANRVTRNEGCFYARNAIDGVIEPAGHGNYPYHSWGGAVHEDLTLKVYFGRPVEVDKLVLHLRADYALNDQGQEHDTYWHTALIELSDGFSEEINPKKSETGQVFELGKHTAEWFKLSRLDPLQHEGSQNFAALTQIELYGKDI
ncbi:MAG: hypothetical protein U0L92_04310 [Clostridia bacterium]|nr:hypothetical protein [Clostridia bacterium]